MVEVPLTTTAIYVEGKTGGGDPATCLKYGRVKLPSWGPDKVMVRMLAAPLNPSDFVSVQGGYPTPMPTATLAGSSSDDHVVRVPGLEGVAVVTAVGEQVQKVRPDLVPGTWVLPGAGRKKASSSSSKQPEGQPVPAPGFGTWRQDVILEGDEVHHLFPVPAKKMSIEAAATLSVNPPSAYRMLRDFVPDLQPGQGVIQNAANSAVGQYVIQMAKVWGYRTINLIRDRPDFDAVASQLKQLGADIVLRDDEGVREYFRSVPTSQRPRLALNCVGGASATALLECLAPKGVHVTYGAMGKTPISVSPIPLLFEDKVMRGFWMTRWKQVASLEEQQAMMHDLVAWYEAGKLALPAMERVPVPPAPSSPSSATATPPPPALLDAFSKAGSGFAGRKYLLVFPEESTSA